MLFNIFYYRMQNEFVNKINIYVFSIEKQNIYLRIIKLTLL